MYLQLLQMSSLFLQARLRYRRSILEYLGIRGGGTEHVYSIFREPLWPATADIRGFKTVVLYHSGSLGFLRINVLYTATLLRQL